MLYSKDTYNTNITEKLVELLNDNITGFREMGWISRSKRFGVLAMVLFATDVPIALKIAASMQKPFARRSVKIEQDPIILTQ